MVENLIRVSGTFLLLGGILATVGWLLFTLLDPGHERTDAPLWPVGNFAVIFGGIFMLMGLPAFYFVQADRAGWFGLMAFVILFVGLALPYIGVQAVETATSPTVPARMGWFVAIGGPALFVGSLLMGIVLLRGDVFPTWLGAALIVAVLLGLLTRVVPMPDWLARGGLITALYTAVIAAAGYLLMLMGR